RQRLAGADGGRLARQYKESGLEGVLGVVNPQELPAHPEDERAMPPQKGGEGALVAAQDELPEQVAVARLTGLLVAGQGADVPGNARQCRGRHVLSSALRLIYQTVAEAMRIQNFVAGPGPAPSAACREFPYTSDGTAPDR